MLLKVENALETPMDHDMVMEVDMISKLVKPLTQEPQEELDLDLEF
jgi:hypothetical protein